MLSRVLPLALGILGAALFLSAAAEPIPDQRTQARRLFDEGNYRDAWEIYRALALNPDNEGTPLADDLTMAIQALQQLQRVHEVDAFREEAVKAHADDWRLLARAAQSLIDGEHYGFIVAGEFRRGDQRGGGQYADATQRDRVRALQLLEQARPLAGEDDDKAAVAEFYSQYAQAVFFSREGNSAWRLQALTDLATLPDYEEGQYWWRGGEAGKGAPVDAEGNPVLYSVPETFEQSASDGQRWRYCLAMIVENNPGREAEVAWTFAGFLHSQFGVQTMQQWGIVLPHEGDGNDVNESGPFALHSLGENETIARLANGVKRFALPDEFNPIVLYRALAAGDHAPYAEMALSQLAQIFEDRQQYPKAADLWRENIRRFGAGANNDKQQRLDQIVGSWGRFENVTSQAAGRGATVELRYRNGKQIHFEARRIKVEELLADIKKYLKSSPAQLDWNQLQIDNLGYRLVQNDEPKYVGERVAQWDLALDPRADHFDRRITVTTPLQDAGAYLLVGTMQDGNTSRIVLWLDDTVIAKKQLDGKAWYYVADARSGAPIEKADVEFFGWRQEQIGNQPQWRIVTSAFAEFSDENGQIIPDRKLLQDQMQWLAIARTDDGRFAHLGFSGVWYGEYYDSPYDETRTYFISDRPVYRPAQKVEYKFWIRKAKYDQPDVSDFANQKFTVVVNDPQGTEVARTEVTSDEYGGIVGTYELPEDAPLGQYSVYVVDRGGGSFRVEEYRKPEYEVTVEAPSEPVRLGEKVAATIRAKYYFGAPVTEATVKFKVHRSARDARWYPDRRWDWLYGNGYWWFTPDYDWYPGFARWGCFGPTPVWWNWSPDPPELVLDQEVPIGADGTVQVEIDTALAKALHGDEDHEYKITAEVVDASRRTIVGSGSVLVAREPFKVFVWADRGYYRVGDTINASFQARTVDGNGVQGEGKLQLLKITYDDQGNPTEAVAQEWDLNTDAEGRAAQQIKASEPGQYRLSYKVTAKGQELRAEGNDNDPNADPLALNPEPSTIEGGYVFIITGEGFDGSEFEFSDLELITDKAEYAPGESVNLLINTNRVGSTVLLFVRPANGVYLPPEILRVDGKSTTHEIAVGTKDMPNFFVEAVTIAGGKVHVAVKEIIVPPQQRVLDLALDPNAEKYKPGEEATIRVTLKEPNGEPFTGSVVLSMYDRAVEYISGGSNVGDIREFFWKWRRSHYPQTEHSLNRWFYNMLKSGELSMNDLGVFGYLAAQTAEEKKDGLRGNLNRRAEEQLAAPEAAAAPTMLMARDAAPAEGLAADVAGAAPGGEGDLVEPTVRTQFADTAYWNGAITTAADGTADITLIMPENLTGWKLRAWGMGHGTKVGEATTEVVTFKNLLVRLQAPRFFVEKDEVVLSAIVHNYLETDKECQVALNLEGETLQEILPDEIKDRITGDLENVHDTYQVVTIPAGGEVRVDWRVKVVREGEAVVTMKALTDEESDAMQMRFPVFVHGMLKTESFSGVVQRDQESGTIDLTVPDERRPEQTRLEVRYSPTLAGAMVDALPYLVDYPYGCTEQTLNRFLPTVITQNILKRMNLDLAAIKEKRTNLNAQEIGDDPQRAADWQRLTQSWHHGLNNPVFDENEVAAMVKVGVRDLTAMQVSDGGWGWFSGWGEHSYPHTTALVVHGLQLAQQNGVALVPGTLERGVEWLKTYQAEQVRLLKIGEEISQTKREPSPGEQYRTQAADIDAMVYMVLVDAGATDTEMQRFLYRDRNDLSLYSQAMFGLALHNINAIEQRDMVIRNIDQFVTVDNENQTAYIDLPNRANYWWYWYGDTIEANAYYLKLLTRVNPQDPRASGLVKYLLNNRRHATYWNSTRDTAVCIEAMAEYLVASGESQSNMLVEVWIDGELKQSVEITPDVLFQFDNSFVIEGEALAAGPHKVELRRKPLGNADQAPDTKHQTPLYYNAYLTNFTLEDHIAAAGLEIKVGRKYYKLVQREDATDLAQGALGEALDQKVDKYDRVELADLSEIQSGDLVEVELEIDSKNDYEYVVFEDPKAAGFEPVEVRSGYTAGGLGAYTEFRDEKVAFFLRTLARGKHSVSYRLYAEIPGRFSALPTRAYAMYAPELKANSDELKLIIEDQPREVARVLQQRVQADYSRTPLRELFANLSEQLGVKFEIDGDALKDAGLTQNMPQTFELGEARACELLSAVLAQYQDLGGGNRMVISIDEEARTVRVLTSKYAREQNRAIYALGPAE